MAGLVDGDGVPLALDVLPVVGQTVLLDVLRRQHVGPGDRVAPFTDRMNQRFVHRFLDRGARRARRDERDVLDIVGELMPHPGELALERARPTFLRGVADLVLAVEAAGAQQRGVE